MVATAIKIIRKLTAFAFPHVKEVEPKFSEADSRHVWYVVNEGERELAEGKIKWVSSIDEDIE